ncbi:MAG TPA: hypothetical protein VFP56_04180 [Candidatus Limnocylindrales bacterium]|nr:hypothetical protein [Candidatus Limnocylindrales bacterium]
MRHATAGFVLAAMVVLGCDATSDPGTAPPETTLPGASATLQIEGRWVACHQLGACIYRAELVSPEGRRPIDLQMVGGDVLAPGAGIPAQLAVGSYALEFISTMLGDTIEPNGSQTVLGEEARCTVQFDVEPAAMVEYRALVSFVPGKCTIDLTSRLATP